MGCRGLAQRIAKRLHKGWGAGGSRDAISWGVPACSGRVVGLGRVCGFFREANQPKVRSGWVGSAQRVEVARGPKAAGAGRGGDWADGRGHGLVSGRKGAKLPYPLGPPTVRGR